MKNEIQKGREPIAAQDRPLYAPPRLQRVRVQTTRTVGGYEYAETHCTIHAHDNASDTGCEF